MGVRARAICVLSILSLFQATAPSRIAYAGDLVGRQSRPDQVLAIVVNQANPINEMTSAELRKIFLGTRSHWPNGRRITVAMLDYEQPERKAVLRQIYRMDEDAYRAYFLKEVYRGEVFSAPKSLASPLIMRKFIFNAPGAIGYLRLSDVDESVKVLRIDGHLPDDKDYPLQIDEPL